MYGKCRKIFQSCGTLCETGCHQELTRHEDPNPRQHGLVAAGRFVKEGRKLQGSLNDLCMGKTMMALSCEITYVGADQTMQIYGFF